MKNPNVADLNLLSEEELTNVSGGLSIRGSLTTFLTDAQLNKLLDLSTDVFSEANIGNNVMNYLMSNLTALQVMQFMNIYNNLTISLGGR